MMDQDEVKEKTTPSQVPVSTCPKCNKLIDGPMPEICPHCGKRTGQEPPKPPDWVTDD